MLKLQRSLLVLVSVALLCLVYVQTSHADDESNLTKEQIKQFLLTAKIVADHSAKKGITDTHRLTLSDGTLTHDASFQSIDVHQYSKTFSDGHTEIRFVDSYKYDIAAYVLAEMVGFDDMMPVYVERKYHGRKGSLSWWLPVMMDEAKRYEKKIKPPDPDAWNLQMYRVRVFDELVYDTDVNLTNVLISPGWKIWRIDFSRAFRTFHALKNPKDLVRCDRKMFEKLKALNADEFAAREKPYLTKDEIQAVIARRDVIVKFFQKKIAEQGENAVLY